MSRSTTSLRATAKTRVLCFALLFSMLGPMVFFLLPYEKDGCTAFGESVNPRDEECESDFCFKACTLGKEENGTRKVKYFGGKLCRHHETFLSPTCGLGTGLPNTGEFNVGCQVRTFKMGPFIDGFIETKVVLCCCDRWKSQCHAKVMDELGDEFCRERLI